MQERHKRWEKLGVEQVRADLESGGNRVVGGTSKVKQAAWEWVKAEEAKQKINDEINFSLDDVSVNLKTIIKLLKTIYHKWKKQT